MAKKIGILIFTNKAKERAFGKNKHFDSKKNFGLNKILSQLDCDYEYCSSVTINDYTDIIVSITSYYDILNIIRNIPITRKCKIHIGGPGVNNIRGILPYIDTAWFGRCDFGEINGIIDGDQFESLWRKTKDQYFENKYSVSVTKKEGLSYVGENETSVGCKQKCHFCHYSWWNGYIEKDEKSYKSGARSYEDFFQSLDWARGSAITGLDGMTEYTRKRVKKPISYKKIKEKLLESNKITDREKNLRLKIYSVIGFPWEKKNEISKCDLIRALEEVGHMIKNNMLLFFHFSHFVPMQKTPLWAAKFNWNNYWQEAKNKPLLFGNDKIKLYTGTSTTSPASAAEETIIQRSLNGDDKILRIIASKKWQALPSTRKIYAMKKEVPIYFSEQEDEAIPNIITPWNYNAINRD